MFKLCEKVKFLDGDNGNNLTEGVISYVCEISGDKHVWVTYGKLIKKLEFSEVLKVKENSPEKKEKTNDKKSIKSKKKNFDAEKS